MRAIDNNCLITKHNYIFPAHATRYSDHLMQSFLDPDQISGKVPCVPKQRKLRSIACGPDPVQLGEVIKQLKVGCSAGQSVLN